MAKKRARQPKAEPLARAALPHDLGTLSVRTLRATATQTFGIKMTFPVQKRGVIEAAIREKMQMAPAPEADGKFVTAVVTDPEGMTAGLASEPAPIPEPEPVAPVAAFEAAMAGIDNAGDPGEPGPAGALEDLPDLSLGERVPEASLVNLVATEPMIEARPEPQPAPPVAPAPAPKPKADGNGFTPVVYRSTIMKLNIQVRAGRGGYNSPEGEPIPPKPPLFADFGGSGNQLCEYVARSAYMVEKIEASDPFKKGVCWRFKDEMQAGLARIRGQLAAMEAAAEGLDPASVRDRIAAATGAAPIVQGARHTQIHSTADAPGQFMGLEATLAGRGSADPVQGARLGAAARDAMRFAQARGEID